MSNSRNSHSHILNTLKGIGEDIAVGIVCGVGVGSALSGAVGGGLDIAYIADSTNTLRAEDRALADGATFVGGFFAGFIAGWRYNNEKRYKRDLLEQQNFSSGQDNLPSGQDNLPSEQDNLLSEEGNVTYCRP